MADSNTPATCSRNGFVAGTLLLMLFHLWSRYAAAPVVDFAGDSWNFLAIGLNNSGWSEALGLFMNEPDRPVQAVLITMLYQIIGDNPLGYAVFSMLGYMLHFGICLLIVQKITKDQAITLIFALLYVLLPNVTETFQWGAMIGVLYMQVFYVLAALLWVIYLEKRNIIYPILSAVFYIAAVASYEFGILLPAVLLLLVPIKEWKRVLPGLVPFILVGILYLTWRFTGGFGQAEGVHFSQRKPTFELWALKENGLALVSWWLGPLMGNSILKGLNGFTQIPALLQWVLILGNVLGLGFVLKFIAQSIQRNEAKAFTSLAQVVLFAFAWFVAGNALSLISWTAPRLNFFPAFGALLGLAAILSRMNFARWAGPLAVIGLLSLCANQGTSQTWKETGIFNRNLYDYLVAHQSEWQDAEVIFMDYEAITQRVTPGLLNPRSDQPLEWAYYENATLLRGFVPEGMLRVIAPNQGVPQVALSTMEHHARIEQGRFKWHRKYNPEDSHETSLEKVFWVDCYTVGLGLID